MHVHQPSLPEVAIVHIEHARLFQFCPDVLNPSQSMDLSISKRETIHHRNQRNNQSQENFIKFVQKVTGSSKSNKALFDYALCYCKQIQQFNTTIIEMNKLFHMGTHVMQGFPSTISTKTKLTIKQTILPNEAWEQYMKI